MMGQQSGPLGADVAEADVCLATGRVIGITWLYAVPPVTRRPDHLVR